MVISDALFPARGRDREPPLAPPAGPALPPNLEIAIDTLRLARPQKTISPWARVSDPRSPHTLVVQVGVTFIGKRIILRAAMGRGAEGMPGPPGEGRSGEKMGGFQQLWEGYRPFRRPPPARQAISESMPIDDRPSGLGGLISAGVGGGPEVSPSRSPSPGAPP